MTAQDAYDRYLIKLNDNFETSKISSDRLRFVINFNEAQNKMVEYTLEKRNSDDIRYIQQIKVPKKELDVSKKEDKFTSFKLPEDYLDFIDISAFCSKGKCKNKLVYLFEIKGENETEILRDEYNKASFKYREAPFEISNNEVVLYKKDFEYNKANIKYYRYPLQLSLEDMDNPESQFSDVKPEFDDKFTDRIISLAVSNAEANSESKKFQLDKLRAQSKI